MPWLSLFIWTPLSLAVLCAVSSNKVFKIVSYCVWIVLLAILCVSIYMLYHLPEEGMKYGLMRGYAWIERVRWFEVLAHGTGWRVDYFLGVDGVNLSLIAMSTVVFLLGAGTMYRKNRAPSPSFLACYMLLFSFVMGALSSLDLLLFFAFFELTAIPIYFLIAFWGGKERRAAALQFLVYALIGSVLFLFVIIGLYSTSSTHITSLPIPMLFERAQSASLLAIDGWGSGNTLKEWAFYALLLSFGIKLAIVPAHGWLPKAHVEASTPISIVLAGVMLKIGGYAILRIGWGVFSDLMHQHASILTWIGIIGLLYAALNALGQKDFKRMIAYSSIAHMSYVWIGIISSTNNGLVGAVYQMITHGLLVSGLFIWSDVLERYGKSRNIDDYSGLWHLIPYTSFLAIVFFFAAFAMPGSGNFVSEILVIIGMVEGMASDHLSWHIIIPIGGGLLLMTAVWVWTLQRMFQGPIWIKHVPLRSWHLSWKDKGLVGVIAGLVILLGVAPQIFIQPIFPATHLIRTLIYIFGENLTF